MSGCPHTEFRRGQRVMLIMTSGKRIIDKYVESKSGVILMRESGRVKTSKIRSAVIYKL